MLVHFPIAFFLGGLLTLIVYALGGDAFWYRVSYIALLAGAAMGLLAGLFGMIDLFGGIPDRTPARRTGIQHMLLNVVAIVVFGAAGVLMYGSLAAYVPGGPNELRLTVPLGLAIGGALLLGVSGALGSKLAYKLHVGQQIDEGADELTVRESGAADLPGMSPDLRPHARGADGQSRHRPLA